MVIQLLATYLVGTKPTNECIALNSSEGARRFSTVEALQKEVILVPQTFDGSQARLLGIALRARVTKIDSRWRIVRTGVETLAIKKGDQDWISSQAKAAAQRTLGEPTTALAVVQNLAETLRHPRPGAPVFEAPMRAQERLPAGHLLAEILQANAANIGILAEPATTTVFSNQPILGEKSISLTPKILDDYLRAEQDFSDWSLAHGEAEISPRNRSLLPNKAFVPGSRTVLLTVSRKGATPEFSLAVYNPNGALEASATTTAQGYEQLVVPREKSLQRAALPENVIQSDERSIPGSSHFSLDLLNPDLRDPLEGDVRASLELYARRRGCQAVIACVPDSLLEAAQSFISGSMVDLDSISRSLSSADIEEIVDGDTLILRPAHTRQEEALRIDRRPLSDEFRAGAKGTFGTENLLRLHASYSETYDSNAFLRITQSRLVPILRLDSLVNWKLPHPVLAVVGQLPPRKRSELSQGGSIRLNAVDTPWNLRPLASYVLSQASLLNAYEKMHFQTRAEVFAKFPAGMTSLEMSPSRIFSGPRPVVLHGSPAAQTMVKRLTREPVERSSRDLKTGEVTNKSEVRILDSDFVPFDLRTLTGFPIDNEQAMNVADRLFQFYWRQENQLAVSLSLGPESILSGIVFREPIRESSSAVNLSQVPGLQPPPRS